MPRCRSHHRTFRHGHDKCYTQHGLPQRAPFLCPCPALVGPTTTAALRQTPSALIRLCSEQCRPLLNTKLSPPPPQTSLLLYVQQKRNLLAERLCALQLEGTGGAGTSGPIPKYTQAVSPWRRLLDGQGSKKGALCMGNLMFRWKETPLLT